MNQLTLPYGANPSSLPANYGFYASIIATILLFGTLWYVFMVFKNRKANSKVFYAITFFWAFVPPLTFWYEYFYIYQVHGVDGTLELFKHSQQVCGALWAAVVASLAVLGGTDEMKYYFAKARAGDVVSQMETLLADQPELLKTFKEKYRPKS